MASMRFNSSKPAIAHVLVLAMLNSSVGRFGNFRRVQKIGCQVPFAIVIALLDENQSNKQKGEQDGNSDKPKIYE